MKRVLSLIIITLLLTMSWVNFCFGQSYPDTIISRIDTIYCIKPGDTVTLISPLDTSKYDFIWSSSLSFSDTLSRQNFVNLTTSDTLIRKSIPRDTLESLRIDTIYAKFHLVPIINIIQPPIDCFNGLPIIITSNSVYDTSYSDENISFYDSFNMPLPGIPFTKNGNLYEVILINGDSIKAKISYSTDGCATIDTLFDIGARFTPELKFNFLEVCFGDSTTIFNQSVFDKGLSDVNISIEGINQNFSSKSDFKCFINQNTDTRYVFVEINQQGCISRDTFVINNKLKPQAAFDFNKTCENEFQVLANQSSETSSTYSVSIFVNNKTYNFIQGVSYTIPDTLPDKTYNFKIKLTNTNGCIDTVSYPRMIDPVTYVSFAGLATDYCEKQDTSILIGTQQGGSFSGQFIANILPGRALFKPLFDTTNLPITYTFTNSFGCTDTETKTVLIVNPKPDLSLAGLLSAYCEKDAATELSINQNIQPNSKYSIFKDGILTASLIGLKYLFNPIVPGQYRIVNNYVDQNQCFSEIVNSTIVNPLPNIDIDSVAVIKPGDFLTVGNNLQNESEVIYSWSNGDTRSFTVIDQPGLYLLEAVNTLTTCMISDTINVRYDKNIKDDLFSIKIFPNPTTDNLLIELTSPKSEIKLFKLSGSLVTINGTTSFSTDILGKLQLNVSNLEIGYYCLKIPDIGDFFILKI